MFFCCWRRCIEPWLRFSPLLRECPDQHEALLDVEASLTCQDAGLNIKEAAESHEHDTPKAQITTHVELPQDIPCGSMLKESVHLPEKDCHAFSAFAINGYPSEQQIAAVDQAQRTTMRAEAANGAIQLGDSCALGVAALTLPLHTEKVAIRHQTNSLQGIISSSDDLSWCKKGTANSTESKDAHNSESHIQLAAAKQPTLKEQLQRELARRSAIVNRSEVTQMTTKQLKEYRAAQALAGGA